MLKLLKELRLHIRVEPLPYAPDVLGQRSLFTLVGCHRRRLRFGFAIRPTPSEEEVAAIVAALDAIAARVAPDASALSESRWRWSGRWWTKPVPLGRERPW